MYDSCTARVEASPYKLPTRRGWKPRPARFLLRDFVERLHGLVEVRRIGFRGARLARPRREHIAARLAEGDFLFLLPVVELHRDGERRLVEPCLCGRVDERARAHVRQL